MKNFLFLLAAFAVASTSSAFAATAATAVQPGTPAPAKLVPSKVVSPQHLPLNFPRTVVNVEFSLDAAGTPMDIKVLSSNKVAKRQIADAFAQWKFSAKSGAQPGRYVLPLEIVPQA